MKTQWIFPTPIYYTMLDDEEVQKEINSKIHKVNFEYGPKAWGKTHMITSNFQGEFNCVIEELQLNKLKKEIGFHLKQFINDTNSRLPKDFKITESWFSKFNKDDFGHIHNHSLSDVSGVYYYKTNGEDGSIFFENPNDTASCFDLTVPQTDRFYHKPEVGKLILFPPYLRHGILKNTTDNDRITISFNLKYA